MRLLPALAASILIGASGCSGAEFKVAAGEDGATSDGTADSVDLRDNGSSDVANENGIVESGTGDASGTPCSSSTPCGLGEYCKLPSCTAVSGNCRSVPGNLNAYDPHCGCDGVTYWNPRTAFDAKMTTTHPGPCGVAEPTVKVCTGSSCGALAGGKCVHEVLNSGACTAGITSGQCWVTPSTASCADVSATAGTVLICTTTSCSTRCAMVLSGSIAAFYASTCT